MSMTEIPNGVRYSPTDLHRTYTRPAEPDPFEAPRVTASAVNAEGTTLERAHAAMVHANKSFQKHLDTTNESKHLYTEEGYRGQIAKFADTAAAKSVDTAVASVQARADTAAALVEKIRRDLSPNGDTAAELRAGRYWDRTRSLLDSAKEPTSAAQKLIAKASREELGTLLQELPAYLEAHGSPHEWIDTVVAQAIPEYGTARTQLTKANAALQFVQMNANSLRRGFSEGRPASVLADPFGDRLGNKAKYDPDQ